MAVAAEPEFLAVPGCLEVLLAPWTVPGGGAGRVMIRAQTKSSGSK